jgi:hypothetical protein
MIVHEVFILLPEVFFLLHANLIVHDVDPTAGDPGARKSDPPGEAQHFPSKNQPPGIP